jgi:hypothetical protein
VRPLLSLVALVALLSTGRALAPPPDPTFLSPCNLGFLILDANQMTWGQLKARYKKARRLHPEIRPEVDGMRLVNSWDWLLAGEKSPHHVYGKTTYDAWEKAARFVREKGKEAEIGSEFMKQIHAIAMEGHYYRGYERRRIEQAMAAKTLSRAEGKALLDRIDRGEKVFFSGTSHLELHGGYRQEAVDDFVHNGDEFFPNGQRYFGAEELKAYRANPYLEVVEKTIRPMGEGKYIGEVRYVKSTEISKTVDKIFAELRNELRLATNDLERVYAITKFQRHMVTVHPFLDGNGRTIRLFADMLYDRYGLPPPLVFHEAELVIHSDEDASKTRAAMALYVKVLENQPSR